MNSLPSHYLAVLHEYLDRLPSGTKLSSRNAARLLGIPEDYTASIGAQLRFREDVQRYGHHGRYTKYIKV